MATTKNNKKSLTQLDLLMEYFQKNPNRDIPHPEIVDWATNEWTKRTSGIFRDPDRGIRRLHQDGYLIKVKKRVYRYDPDAVKQKDLEDFPAGQKAEILKRDNYKCIICGRSEKDGVELRVDHIKPKDRGGKATVANGVTLCSQHDFMKENSDLTETAKRMFICLYELAKEENYEEIQDFCADVLQIYEDHDINGHIEWIK